MVHIRDTLEVLFAIVPGWGNPERELVIPDVMPAMGMRDLVVGFGCACSSKEVSLLIQSTAMAKFTICSFSMMVNCV